MASPSDVTPDQLDMAARFLNEVFTSPKDEFLLGLINAINDEDAAGFGASRGYDVSQVTNWEALMKMATPGPYFDLRLAGGAYRFAENAFGLSELFVNSAKSTIHVDGELVESLAVNQGDVSFITKDQVRFKIQFQCAQLAGIEQSDPLFEGEMWSASNEAQKMTITGTKYFPWGDTTDTSSDFSKDFVPGAGSDISVEKLKAAAAVRVDASLESIVVAMDLVNGCMDPPEDLASSIPGPVIYTGISVLTSAIGAGLGAFVKDGVWPAAIGAGIGGVGTHVASMLVAAFNNRYVTKQSFDMKAFIRQYGQKEDDDTQQLLSLWDKIPKWIQASVGQLTNKDLEDDPKVHVGTIRSLVKSKYTKEVKAQVKEAVFTRYRWFRYFGKEKYLDVLDKEVIAKFEVDVSPDSVDKYILREISRRKAEKDKKDMTDQISVLQANISAQKLKEDNDIRTIDPGLPPEDKAAEEQRIRQKYEKEIERLEDKITQKKDQIDEDANKRNPMDIEEIQREIQRETQEKRRNERESQIDSHMPV
ncbi:hypothetical protein BDV25DRAFT_137118 [Aspergillus avenaceus]|uniref:Uncharacterized protein n=1 Tax=Aspergillus avenaceus TaxID=36643 RepID=A0A5N6U3R9_ASPAV|nr:hypothetical protein BDV25DRAFT_137118 [Aspergillus avenaceus]